MGAASPGEAVLVCVRKVIEQASEQQSCVASATRCPPWLPLMMAVVRTCKPNQPFSPNAPFGRCLITAAGKPNSRGSLFYLNFNIVYV